MNAGNFMIETNSPSYQGFVLFWTKAEAVAAFKRFWAPDDGVLLLWQGRFWQDAGGLVTAARGKRLLEEVQGEPEEFGDDEPDFWCDDQDMPGLADEEERRLDDLLEEFEERRRQRISESLEY